MEKIERLNLKIARALDAARALREKSQIEALQREKEKRQKNMDNNRRKQVVGAIVVKLWESGSISTPYLIQLIGPHIYSEQDRALFECKAPGAQVIGPNING